MNKGSIFRDYSFRAQQVVFLARLKAGQRGAEAVEAEDLLTALILEDQGEFPKVFPALSGSGGFADQGGPKHHQPLFTSQLAHDLLAQVQGLFIRLQPVPNGSDLPVSQSAQRIFTRASSVRDEFQQRHVEPLHLLLAILEDESSRATQVLRTSGVTRESVLMALPQGGRQSGNAAAAEDPFTADLSWGRARLVLALAGLRAWARGAATIETEDTLAALIMEDQGEASDVLPEIRQHPDLLVRLRAKAHPSFFTPSLARHLLAGLTALQRGSEDETSGESRSRCVGIASPELLSQPPPPYALVPMSEGTSRAFHVGDKLRTELHHNEIQPLHLLAVILEDKASRGAEVFRQAGITREKIIQFTREKT